MFTGYEHDPPDNDNIMLCAGPEERKALSNILLYRTPICNCDDFINELHTVLQKQTNSITQINEKFGPNTLREEDACVSFDRHLSDMCQEDVDKVMRHLHVLFITREYDVTGVNGLDYQVTIRRRESIFKDFIIPWIDWVRSAKQNRSDTVVSDKAINQSKTDSSNIDKKPNTIEYNTNITTNNKLTNNIKYTMFSKFEHDPPDNDDILLCAGPKERKALEEALRHHPHIYSVERFITTLHSSVQKQAACIEDINYALKTDLLYAEDAEISFDKHLSGMCQEDVDKVFKHLGVLLIDRRHMLTGNYTLDVILSDDDRKEIYNEIIVPWLNWVRSAKQDKSIAEMSDNTDTEVSNKDSHIFNQFKNEFEYQSGNDSDNNIILYANNAERYALQKALMDYMSSNAASTLIEDIHMFLDDDSPEGDTCFYKLNRGEVEDVLNDVKYLVTESYGELDTLEDFDEEQRNDLYNNVFEPWFRWLQEQKPKKANGKKATTNVSKKSNTSTNNKVNTPTNTNTNNTMNDNTTDKTMNASKNNMFGSIASIFSNMLGTLEPNTIRLTFDGNIAVKTAKGYKTYSVAKKKAVNMDSLVMPDMSVFLLLPSTKVKPGDIIFRDDIFYSIISVDNEKGELEVYNYEAGKRETLVKETHCFLGNTYFYSKLISPILSCFGKKSNPVDKKDEGSVGTETSEDTASMLLPLAMMSQNGDMNSLLPLMLMSKMEGNGESSGMMKMLMLSSMMGNNTGMNNMLPLMLLDGNFPSI